MKPETTVLRVVVGKELVKAQDYTDLRASAARFLKARNPLIKDIWGMAEEDPGGGRAIVFLVSVNTAQSEQFLRDSGRAGIFYEPTGSGKTPVVVTWHTKGEEKTAQDYLNRLVAKKEAFGVTFGRRQLGPRVKQDASKERKSWRLQGTLPRWTEDFVAEIVRDQNAGYQQARAGWQNYVVFSGHH